MVNTQECGPLDLTSAELAEWLAERNIPKYRAKQIFQGFYKSLAADYDGISALPKALREELTTIAPMFEPVIVRELRSSDDRTMKLLLRLSDGKLIETALMLYPPSQHGRSRATVCVSTQAGCAFGCTFCATGQMGFDRHLTAGEIVAQIIIFARMLRREPWKYPKAMGFPAGEIDHITNIVLMGMGEPLHNYDNSMQALRIVNDPEGFYLGARHMTVSTVGVIPGIRRLAQEPMQVNLAISLHAPNNVMRLKTMPVAKKWRMDDLLAACREYIQATGRQVTFEYVLLAGINDASQHAIELASRMQTLKQFAHVNLIPVNATSAEYRPPTGADIAAFRTILTKAGVSNSVRAERGDDIAASCGQLRTRETVLRQA